MIDRSTFIDGKYELLDKIGEGGMAIVWRATMHGAAGFTRRVAVKKIKQHLHATDRYIRMFVEEARVGSELAHPNIVQVVDFTTDAAGSYYLIMEWVEGLDLAAFCNSYARASEKPPWHLVVGIGIGALRGLAAAHERRRDDGTHAPVIHRDISPHNILLASNGVAKLSDFGLARARDRIESLTGPGVVKGKLGYWAPEIAGGGEANQASDLYSMGIVLWECLAMERLFDGATQVALFRQVSQGVTKQLVERRADLPPRLLAAIHRALHPDPAERFPSARAMAQELAEVLREAKTGDAHSELSAEILRGRQRLGGRHLPGSATPPGLSHEITFSEESQPATIGGHSVDIHFSDPGFDPDSKQ
jgi:serine/threonine-protein kinase